MQADMNAESRTRRARRHSFSSFLTHSPKLRRIESEIEEEMKPTGGTVTEINSIKLREVKARRDWMIEVRVTGFIPFHEVHSAFINYMKWINLAKLNGMRMNDIITVLNESKSMKVTNTWSGLSDCGNEPSRSFIQLHEVNWWNEPQCDMNQQVKRVENEQRSDCLNEITSIKSMNSLR